MPYLHPLERTARNHLRGLVASGAALIFIPTIVAVLIIVANPVSTKAEEDAIKSLAFYTWAGLTLLLLLTTIALVISSFIAYRRLSKEYSSTDWMSD